MKKRIFSVILCITMVFTVLFGANLTASAASGEYTGTTGFTVIAYPDGERINMIPVSGAASYAVYMSTDNTLTAADVTTASCLFSSSAYQPYAYFTN